MKPVLDAVMTFFTYAVIALFAQNSIFSRGLGVSRLIQLVGDDEVSSFLFGVELCVIQLLAAPASWGMNKLLRLVPENAALRPLAYVLCVCAVCGLLYLVLEVAKLSVPRREHFVQILPLAGFNSTVVGTLLVTTTQGYSIAQCVGFGLGSGLGFMVAVALVTEAQRRLRSRAVPVAFQGLPITLIYIGILTLAIYAFTGHTVIL